MDRTISIAFIILFNLVPIVGVAFYNWQPFEAFWFFWVETLVIAVFNTIRIIFSQGQTVADIDGKATMVFNFGKGIKYLFTRIGIFLFYSVFIIVFIGFLANTSDDKFSVLTTIFFQNTFFNIGLLISILSQGFYLINNFFRNRAFVTAAPNSYAAIFDGRQLIMHVAIVLGGASSILLIRYTAFGNLGAIIIISVLCIGKCIYDIANTKEGNHKMVEQ